MARNDITGDTIANTKGSAEKYAQGWDRLFGKKVEAPHGELGHFMVDDSCVQPMMVEPAFIESSFGKSYDSFTQPFNSFTMPPAGPSHSVMALDFHDSQPAKRDIFEKLLEGFDALQSIREEAEQAREDAWVEAVMKGRYVQSGE